MCFEIEGLRPLDNILRLAVETNPAMLEVSMISVVEADDAGNPVAVYSVPLEQPQARNITVMQTRPVELPPPQLEPLAKIEEVVESETHGTERQQIAKADTGSK